MHYLADRILYLTAERELRELLPAELLGDTRYAGVVSNPTVIT